MTIIFKFHCILQNTQCIVVLLVFSKLDMGSFCSIASTNKPLVYNQVCLKWNVTHIPSLKTAMAYCPLLKFISNNICKIKAHHSQNKIISYNLLGLALNPLIKSQVVFYFKGNHIQKKSGKSDDNLICVEKQ